LVLAIALTKSCRALKDGYLPAFAGKAVLQSNEEQASAHDYSPKDYAVSGKHGALRLQRSLSISRSSTHQQMPFASKLDTICVYER
jgi:hypothetical protein